MRITVLATALLISLSHTVRAENLSEAYALARANDPQLQLADAARRSALEGVVQARSVLLPQASAGYAVNRSEGSAPLQNDQNGVLATADITSDSQQLDLSVTQSIYDRADYTRLESAKAQAERADLSFRAAEQTLLTRVAQAYFQVLTAQDALTSAKAEEKAVERQLEQAEQRFNVGLTAITDVHEARARFDGAVAAAILAENEVDDAFAALTEITGKNIDQTPGLVDEIPLSPPAPSDWQSWVDTALAKNPALAARLANEKAARADIKTAKAGHLPSISSSLNFNDSSSDAETKIPGLNAPIVSDTERDNISIGVRLNVPIFSGFATQSRVKQAVIQAESATDEVEQERRAITRQTRNAFRAVIAGTSEVKARSQALVSAKAALEATEAGFEVGTRTLVDVLLSQQVLFQAQRDYSRARHNYLLSKLRLKSAAGTIAPADLDEINALLQGS
jgi:outer membrane protein